MGSWVSKREKKRKKKVNIQIQRMSLGMFLSGFWLLWLWWRIVKIIYSVNYYAIKVYKTQLLFANKSKRQARSRQIRKQISEWTHFVLFFNVLVQIPLHSASLSPVIKKNFHTLMERKIFTTKKKKKKIQKQTSGFAHLNISLEN